jgi:hypothetical protein
VAARCRASLRRSSLSFAAATAAWLRCFALTEPGAAPAVTPREGRNSTAACAAAHPARATMNRPTASLGAVFSFVALNATIIATVAAR